MLQQSQIISDIKRYQLFYRYNFQSQLQGLFKRLGCEHIQSWVLLLSVKAGQDERKQPQSEIDLLQRKLTESENKRKRLDQKLKNMDIEIQLLKSQNSIISADLILQKQLNENNSGQTSDLQNRLESISLILSKMRKNMSTTLRRSSVDELLDMNCDENKDLSISRRYSDHDKVGGLSDPTIVNRYVSQIEALAIQGSQNNPNQLRSGFILMSSQNASPLEQKILDSQSNSKEQFRFLSRDDYSKGFPKVLAALTEGCEYDENMFLQRFDEIYPKQSHSYKIIVVEDKQSGQIVGCGTVFNEKKFVRNTGITGHIEDIVVTKASRGQNIGLRIIQVLTEIGFSNKCYKVILDCTEQNVGFYEKCGYKRNIVQMCKYKL